MRRHPMTVYLLTMMVTLVGAAAAEPVVDQQCLPEYWGSYSIALGGPIGQEFVPAAEVLTFVDLWVISEPASTNDTASVFVVVHADSIQGPELGTSVDVAIPKPYHGEVRLHFPGPVALVPGRTHVIEVRRAQGPGNPMLLWGDQAGSCPGVSGIWEGRIFPNGGDFWYRTGFDPTPVRSASWGGVKRGRFE